MKIQGQSGNKKRENEIDMIHGPLAGKILLFALPLVFSNLLQMLFNAADVMVVGRFAGDASLAAVGSTTSLIALMTNLFIGMSIGANVVAANAIGAGDEQKASDTVATSILFSAACGAAVAAVGIFLCRPLLVLMGSPDTVLAPATVYMRIYFLGMPSVMLYNFGSALLRAQGDTKRPLYYLTASGILNVVLNCIFVICFHMGVAGVALATIISQTLSAVLVLHCMKQEKGWLHLELVCKAANTQRGKLCINPVRLRMDFYILGKILQIGLPAGIQSMLFSLSNVVIQSAVNSFGETVIAGNAAAHNIGNFVYQPINALQQTAISFCGQNRGAKEYDRIDRVMTLCLAYVLVLGWTLSIAAYVNGPLLLGFYTTSAAVVTAGMVRMKYCILMYGLCGPMDLMPGVLRGMGYSVIPMVVTLTGSCLFRILWVNSWFQFHHTIEDLLISYPISWVMTFTVHLLCFLILRRKMRTRG